MELISRLNEWEASLIRRLVPETHAAWDTVMLGLTRVGDGWLWGLAVLASIHHRSPRIFAAGVLACATANLLFILIKRATVRERPCRAHRDLRAVASAPDYYSFPSGHAINAFAATAVLEAVAWTGIGPLLLTLAFGIGVSRVYLKLHYPTDVFVGAVLGRTIGTTALLMTL